MAPGSKNGGDFRRWRKSMFGLMLSFLSFSAQADLWAYVDEQGITHFAASQMDERYRLFYKGNDLARLDFLGGFKGGRSAPPSAQPEGEPPAALPKRFANLDASKSYQSVQQHLRAAAQSHQLDVELLKAVVAAESGFDADAVSPKGAVGLMQLMPATAQRYGVVADKVPGRDRRGQPVPARSVADKLTDPRTNVNAGARYLADLLKLFKGQLDLALAAYNAGEGAVQRAGNQIPNYRETQAYVKTVMGLYAAFKPSVLSRPKATGPSAAQPKPGVRWASPRVRVELSGPVPGSTAGGVGTDVGALPASSAPVVGGAL